MKASCHFELSAMLALRHNPALREARARALAEQGIAEAELRLAMRARVSTDGSGQDRIGR
jgi:hypothetical protein